MPIVSGGPQQSYAGKVEEPAKPRRLRRPGLGAGAEPERPRRIGVVFVHGIGSQRPGETLLDWSRPIIKALTEWIAAHRATPDAGDREHIDPSTARDPVDTSHVDFSGSQLPIIEVDVPATTADDERSWPAQTWVLTEAWWAARVQPPSLGSMTDWIRRDFGRVVDGIREGIGEDRAEDRLAGAAPSGGVPSGGVPSGRAPAGGALPGVPADPIWVNRLDHFTVARVRPLLTLVWSFAYVLLLLPYAFIRSLPIGALRDAAGLRQLDSFLVDWFGDMRILLRDPSQAANVRGRLADTIRTIRTDYQCDDVVVVAHSGGALVSFTTLTDPGFLDDPRFDGLRVDKLVTLGQGLDLAWRLSGVLDGVPDGDRLAGNITTSQPGLRWIDFWSTYDPAPGGKFRPPNGMTPAVQSLAVRNRMSILEDHGGYWDNDEEFVIPLLRQIETATGDVTGSRFFGDESAQRTRVIRRKARVGTLAAWRWVAALTAAVTLLIAVARTIFTPIDRLGDVGRWTLGLLGRLPGHEVLSAPIDAAAAVVALVPAAPDRVASLAGGIVFGLVAGLLAWLLPRLVLGEPWHDLATRPPLRRIEVPVLKPIVWVGLVLGLVGAIAVPAQLADGIRTLASPTGGQWAAGAGTIAGTFIGLARLGIGRWGQWDADERWRSRHDPPMPLDRTRWRIEGAVLVAVVGALGVFLAVG